jgi:gas vesicle protein
MNRKNNQTPNIMAKSSSKIMLAGLAGLAIGIAAGVLMAPSKGSKTRKRLKKKFRKMEDLFQHTDLSEMFNKVKEGFKKNKEDKPENEVPSGNPDQPIT